MKGGVLEARSAPALSGAAVWVISSTELIYAIDGRKAPASSSLPYGGRCRSTTRHRTSFAGFVAARSAFGALLSVKVVPEGGSYRN